MTDQGAVPSDDDVAKIADDLLLMTRGVIGFTDLRGADHVQATIAGLVVHEVVRMERRTLEAVTLYLLAGIAGGGFEP